MATQPANSLGVPIRMPRENNYHIKSSSTRSIRKIRSGMGSAVGSPRPAPRLLSKNLPIIVMKRKRNEEPLDGLCSDPLEVLDMGSRSRSDLNLAKSAAAEASANEEEEDGGGDASMKPNLPARKRKKVTTSRGFFQLADTVESAKWDDEAWRRDFNERILAQSKESKRALAAAAGVPLPLDSPVTEKTQPAPSSSPVKESTSKPNRRYTAVLQERPQGSDGGSLKGKGKEAILKKDSTKDTSLATVGTQADLSAPSSVLYFNAVPVPDSSEDERNEKEKQDEDEVAAFLPMLQDYLKLNDIPPAKILPDKKRGTKTGTEGLRSTAKDGGGTASQATSDEDEYVYDVYFKGNNEPTSSDWNNLSNYGTLVGLPPEAKDDDGDSEGVDDNSDYDIDDDSNDEGFYRNDYPDEEDGEESDLEESDDFYDERDDSDEEEDYDHDAPWRH